jgi:hypothetical protein
LSEAQFHRDNHYVPCVYLKGFASSKERVFGYRTLVPRREIPPWRERPIKGVGHLLHLYTRIAAGRETDEIERWLDRDFETPAAEPIQKATSDSRLTPEDWRHLVRFLSAQMVRTPAYFVENFPRWQATLPDLMNSTLQESVRKLEAAKRSGEPITAPDAPNSDYLPVRVTAEVRPGQESGHFKATMVVGRNLWLFNMRHLLSRTGATRLLHEHRWSILAPCKGLTWFTSDDPVIRLNYGEKGYNFKGGCGKPGTEIFLPLGPYHLLYTRIGHLPPSRGTVLPRAETERIRRFVAEHAFRMIFAASPDADVVELRPRTVDDALFRNERKNWQAWHAEQTMAEQGLVDPIRS